MPQITPYESQVNPQGEISTKQASGEGVGSGLAKLGQGLDNAADNIFDYQARHQALEGSKGFSDIKFNQETAIYKMNKSFDPKDPEAQQKVLKGYDDSSKQLLDSLTNYKARDHVAAKIDTARDSLWISALEKNAVLQAKENTDAAHAKSTLSSASSYQSPELLEQNISDIKDFVKLLPGPQGKKDELEQQMIRASTVSAVQGSIRDNPRQALKELETGKKWDLNGADTDKMIARAEGRIRAQERDSELSDKREQHAIMQQQKQNHQDLYHGIDDGKVDNRQIDDAYAALKITPQQHTDLESRLKSLMDGTAKGDPNVFMDALKRLRLPDGDPNKISDFETLTSQYGQGAGKGLDQNSLKALTKIYLQPKNAGAADQAMFSKVIDQAQKELIQPTFVPWGDRTGMSLFGKALTAMHKDYESKMASGNYNSQQLLDPASKDYIGKAIPAFKRSRSDMSADAQYLIHGPKASSQAGTTQMQPPGASGQLTPMPEQKSKFTPKQQAVIDAISKSIGASK